MPVAAPDPNPIIAYIPMISAFSALGGVIGGGVIQMITTFLVANQTRKDRLADEAAARERKRVKRQAEADYVKAILARHLEAYARSCAEVIWENGEEDSEGAMSPPAFPAWPDDIKWELIGASEMMAARDIEVRVEIRSKGVEGDFHYNAADVQDARQIFSDGAARIGWEAWTIAKDIREEIGVHPFRYPDHGGNHAETLQERAERLETKARQYEERRQARAEAEQI